MKENKIKLFVFLIVMLLCLSISGLIFIILQKSENPNDIHDPIIEKYNYSLVYDFNEYQAVYNSLQNYFNLLNTNSDSLLNLLFTEYKEHNKITSENINNFIEKKYENFAYTITDIKKYSNPYFSIYFVKGNYLLEALDEVIEETRVQDIVINDLVNNTYAILPVLDNYESFESIIGKYHLENYDIEIKRNNSNTIPEVFISEFNEVTMYFDDFISKITSNCEEVYSLLAIKTKEKYLNLQDFVPVCTQYKTLYLSPILLEYKIEYINGKRNISVVDNYSITYNFVIESVKDYEVDILK